MNQSTSSDLRLRFYLTFREEKIDVELIQRGDILEVIILLRFPSLFILFLYRKLLIRLYFVFLHL